MKRRNALIALCAACCLALALIGTTAGNVAAADDTARVQQWGEADKAYDRYLQTAPAADSLKIKADDFTVTNTEYDHQVELAKLAGYTDAEKRAMDVLIGRYAVYYCALREGYSISEEELDAYVAGCKADMEGADNIQDYYDYLAARGITEEEYWADFKENRRYYCVIAKYKQPYYDAFCQEHPGFDSTDPDDAQLWEDYWDQVVDAAAKAEHVTVY